MYILTSRWSLNLKECLKKSPCAIVSKCITLYITFGYFYSPDVACYNARASFAEPGGGNATLSCEPRIDLRYNTYFMYCI